MERIHSVIIGGGAIGLSIARYLSKFLQKECILLEKNMSCGMETSSRSSEVLHAGIYYPLEMAKTKFCISGRLMLLDYLKENRIYYNLCGKLVVATSDAEITKLHNIFLNSQRNGLNDVKLLTAEEVKIIEPNVRCQAGLLSPYSGVFDTHGVIQSLIVDVEESNSTIATNCEFKSCNILKINGRTLFQINTNRGQILADFLINAGGLLSPQIARQIPEIQISSIPIPYYSKGNYFKLQGVSLQSMPFTRLIYPIPTEGGLGVHSTIDLQGAVKFGPDVQWIKSSKMSYNHDLKMNPNFSYEVNSLNKANFYSEISKYWPDILHKEIIEDYCGIRPKLCGPGKDVKTNTIMSSALDFQIHDMVNHGIPGLINIFGIESPGWTSSLSIGKFIAEKIQ